MSREVSSFETAQEYEQAKYWVRHVHKYSGDDIPSMDIEQAELARSSYKDE